MSDTNSPKLTYSEAGVDYSSIDPAKVSAQSAAKSTSHNLSYFNMEEISASRGESAFVWKEQSGHRAFVVEGLGTKNLVADVMYPLTGKSYYDQIAQDTVAMIVNDLVVVGALPNVINAYFAVGDSNWLNDKQRSADLISGWAKACELSGATWGGGETPALKGIINPETIDLAGSAVGSIPDGKLVLGDKLTDGDVIVLIESSGIHSNGLTLARTVAESLPDGYLTKLDDERTYGEALLNPTHLYVELVRSLLESDADLHYMVNITGHGWRKLMRADQEFSYELHRVPPVPEEFKVIQKTANIDDAEMYGNFNMGAGFAVYIPAKDVNTVLACADLAGLKAWNAGVVKSGSKKVTIKPLDIEFDGSSLGVRK